jgi:hypothetical protein
MFPEAVTIENKFLASSVSIERKKDCVTVKYLKFMSSNDINMENI